MSDQFEQKPSITFKKIEETISEKESDEKIWGGATDPRRHSPQKYRYLVHAFNPLAANSQGLVAASAALSGLYKNDRSQGDQSINLFDRPERLGERVSLSMSLIDHEHTGTWGEGGIIVESPEENIIITSPTDAGSFSSNKEFLKKQAHNQQLLSGDELLKSSNNEILNEVVALAKSDTGKTIKLRGFFIKVDKRAQPTNSSIAEKMKQHAGRLNLPLVEIPVKGRYEQEMLKIAENSIYAHFKGNRYNLGSEDPESAFNAYDDKSNTFFPSSQEMEEVLTHFVERGNLEETQVQQIRKKYKIADIKKNHRKLIMILKRKR